MFLELLLVNLLTSWTDHLHCLCSCSWCWQTYNSRGNPSLPNPGPRFSCLVIPLRVCSTNGCICVCLTIFVACEFFLQLNWMGLSGQLQTWNFTNTRFPPNPDYFPCMPGGAFNWSYIFLSVSCVLFVWCIAPIKTDPESVRKHH